MTPEQFIAVGEVVSVVATLVGCTAWIVSKMTRIELVLATLAVRVQALEDRNALPAHHRRD